MKRHTERQKKKNERCQQRLLQQEIESQKEKREHRRRYRDRRIPEMNTERMGEYFRWRYFMLQRLAARNYSTALGVPFSAAMHLIPPEYISPTPPFPLFNQLYFPEPSFASPFQSFGINGPPPPMPPPMPMPDYCQDQYFPCDCGCTNGEQRDRDKWGGRFQ
jgi:hypothetical protein